MREVFVDTSAFYAHLDASDTFHAEATAYLVRAAEQGWTLVTTNYVVLETLALIQGRLGWSAVNAFQDKVLRHCEVSWVDESLHALGEARWAQARERRLSLTDCISFEFMRLRGLHEAIFQDEHFTRVGLRMPD